MGDTNTSEDWKEAIRALYPCKIFHGAHNTALYFTHEEHMEAAKAMCLIQGLNATLSIAFRTIQYPYGILVDAGTATNLPIV